MDDTSVAVRISLKEHLKPDPTSRPKPLKFSERTEQVLPDSCNPLLLLLKEFEEFTSRNKMLVNTAKTKVMKFNRASSMDFPLEVYFNNKQILEEVNMYKLLGVMVSSNLKWNENTDYICTKARKKIWLLRNMKRSGLTQCELIDAYKKEVRSLLELAVPVWHSILTKDQSNQFDGMQN